MVSMELSEEEARRITESRQQQTAVAERRVLIGFVIDESGSMANCVRAGRGGQRIDISAAERRRLQPSSSENARSRRPRSCSSAGRRSRIFGAGRRD